MRPPTPPPPCAPRRRPAVGAPVAFSTFVTANLIPVTLGNIVGGAPRVGAAEEGGREGGAAGRRARARPCAREPALTPACLAPRRPSPRAGVAVALSYAYVYGKLGAPKPKAA